ncbi:hypothetical protein FJZ53_00265 [Candidatus Woesearchaeota archaeon]|nr:hypothetical protein [Candidatus Woesearchaeota archaeon]
MNETLKRLRILNLEETKQKLKQPSDDNILIQKYKTKDHSYKELARRLAPNLTTLIGEELATELIITAKSLQKLAFMTSSKIQVLGAEAALFRHLKEKTKPPKHGIIFNHPSVQEAENKGKAARKLSAKISIAAKKDYFRASNG